MDISQAFVYPWAAITYPLLGVLYFVLGMGNIWLYNYLFPYKKIQVESDEIFDQIPFAIWLWFVWPLSSLGMLIQYPLESKRRRAWRNW